MKRERDMLRDEGVSREESVREYYTFSKKFLAN